MQPSPPVLSHVCTRGCAYRLLHAYTAELTSERLSCLIATAPEVGVVVLARTSPDPLLEKVFSGNQFLPKALFVLPVPGETEREGRCFARLSERHWRGFCRGSSPRIFLSAVLPNSFPNAISTLSRVLLQALTAQRVLWLLLGLTTSSCSGLKLNFPLLC